MRRTWAAVILGGCGCSATILLAIYVFRSFYKTGKEASPENPETKQKQTEPILENCEGHDVDLPTSESRDDLIFQEYKISEVDSGISDPKTQDDSPASSVSSYTSCEEELQNAPETDSSSNSDSSGQTGPDRSVEGAVGESTYRRHTVTALSESEFQDLLLSPVVQSADVGLNDERIIQGRSPSEDCEIVWQYDSELSPSKVDEQCRSVSNMYSDIVAPLCPNTGTIIPEANITTRKRTSCI